jgi:hypothetical protein
MPPPGARSLVGVTRRVCSRGAIVDIAGHVIARLPISAAAGIVMQLARG